MADVVSEGERDTLCCLCAKIEVKRYLLHLGDNKCKSQKTVNKIVFIIGQKFDSAADRSVCLSCFGKVNACFAFKTLALESLRLRDSASSKRSAHTPLAKPTPKRKRDTATRILLSSQKAACGSITQHESQADSPSPLACRLDTSVSEPTPTRRRIQPTVVEQIRLSVEKLKLKTLPAVGKHPSSRRKLELAEHSYAKQLSSPGKKQEEYKSAEESAKCALTSAGLAKSRNSGEKLSDTEKRVLANAVQGGKVVDVLRSLFQIPAVFLAVQDRMFRTLAGQKRDLLFYESIHYKKDCDTLVYDNVFADIVAEAAKKAPLLIDLLSVLFSSSKGPCNGSKQDIASIATVIGMALHHRDKNASIVQRMYTTLAVRCHADNQMLSRLNKVHLMLADKRALMKTFSQNSEERLVQTVCSGKDGKINGDNLDIRVSTNDQRMAHRARDYHFFASDWTPFRLQATHEEARAPVGNIEGVTFETFKPTEQERLDHRRSLKILIAREIVKHFPSFKWMKMVIPNHIDHPYSEVMARKSSPLLMPLLLKNEMKHEDCISIMASYTQQLHSWYTKAGRAQDLKGLQVPVGGDQLTRVRLEGAKALRAGSHTPEERFDMLRPVIIELFHTQMDFLEKMCKKFLKLKQSRDEGTIGMMRIRIDRSSVNANVKSRFGAHQDFIELAGRVYLLEGAKEYFGMETAESTPTKNEPPPGIERTHRKRHEEAFDTVMEGFLDFLDKPTEPEVEAECQTLQLEVTISGTKFQTTARVGGENVTLKLNIGNKLFDLNINKSKLLKHSSLLFNIPGITQPLLVSVVTIEADYLENYCRNFLQWYFILITMVDAIAEGDIFRTNVVLKMMIPFFYSHSPLSRYLVECIDYILKTEVMLSRDMSLRVRCASFVNMHGGVGRNVAADMEKEHQVKFLKDLIRGLGANKTEKSVAEVCSAGPVVLDVIENLDSILAHKAIHTTHKRRPEDEELNVLSKHLRKLRPFHTQPGRKLSAFPRIAQSVFANIDQAKFEHDVLAISNRLKRNLSVEIEISDSEDEQS